MEKLKQLFTDHYVIPEEWLWVIFGVVVLLLLFFDLFLFNRKNEVPNFWHTLNLCIIYILAACVFGVFIIYEEGVDKGMDFFTGFLVEKSLSLDNIFIMSLIFSSLGVPRADVPAPGFVLGDPRRNRHARSADPGRGNADLELPLGIVRLFRLPRLHRGQDAVAQGRRRAGV